MLKSKAEELGQLHPVDDELLVLSLLLAIIN